jgi:hypothetical protein
MTVKMTGVVKQDQLRVVLCITKVGQSRVPPCRQPSKPLLQVDTQYMGNQ